MEWMKPLIDPEQHMLICMVGLPRSGKSTWAKEQAEEYAIPIVNGDAIRLAIHGERYLPAAEELVKTTALYMVKALFYAGHDTVIVDETNTTRERRDFWSKNRPWKTVFHLIDTTKEECLKRAAGDDRIQPVIERMDSQWEDLQDDEERFGC